MKLKSRTALLLLSVILAIFVGAAIVLLPRMLGRDASGAEKTVVSDSVKLPAKLDENSGAVKATLPLFHRISPDYIRGSEPASGGVELLARLGVKTIVDLRSKYDWTDRVQRAAEGERLGYYWRPLSVWDPPTDDETASFLSIVSDPSKAPVFVFCADGVNRTGEMTAIYRVEHDHLTTEQAVKEMDDLGFSPYYYSLRSYVWDYTRQHHPPIVTTRSQ